MTTKRSSKNGSKEKALDVSILEMLTDRQEEITKAVRLLADQFSQFQTSTLIEMEALRAQNQNFALKELSKDISYYR